MPPIDDRRQPTQAVQSRQLLQRRGNYSCWARRGWRIHAMRRARQHEAQHARQRELEPRLPNQAARVLFPTRVYASSGVPRPLVGARDGLPTVLAGTAGHHAGAAQFFLRSSTYPATARPPRVRRTWQCETTACADVAKNREPKRPAMCDITDRAHTTVASNSTANVATKRKHTRKYY